MINGATLRANRGLGQFAPAFVCIVDMLVDQSVAALRHASAPRFIHNASGFSMAFMIVRG